MGAAETRASIRGRTVEQVRTARSRRKQRALPQRLSRARSYLATQRIALPARSSASTRRRLAGAQVFRLRHFPLLLMGPRTRTPIRRRSKLSRVPLHPLQISLRPISVTLVLRHFRAKTFLPTARQTTRTTIP